MTENDKKYGFSDADTDDAANKNGESTIFSDPSENLPKKIGHSTKKGKTALKKQRLAILITLAVIVLILATFFTAVAVRKLHVRMGEKYDELKALMLSTLSPAELSQIDEYDTFSDWLAAHRSDLSISSLIERNENFRAILDKEPALDRMLKKISKNKDFANYIDNISEDPEAEIKVLEGEVLGTSNRIYMYEPYDRSDIAHIKVNNSSDSWGFVYNAETDEFVVENYPDAPFSKEMFSSLVVTAGKPTVIERVFDSCEDFSQYGLDESQAPASFSVTSRDGAMHTVYVGNLTAAGNGYYARHADRDALYTIAASLESTVLQKLEVMITPTLALPMVSNDYFTAQNFAIISDDEVKVAITYLDANTQSSLGLNSPYYMLHPGAYSVNSTNYMQALETIRSFEGTRTVVYDPSDEELKEYGLDAPKFRVSYEYDFYGEGTPIEQEIYFSERNEDGIYYALSPLFNLIAEVDSETAEWLDWDLLKWVDKPIFMMNINEIATITVESDTATRIFDLDGVDRELTVTERITGIKPEVENFRQFYKLLLSTELQGTVSDDISREELDKLEGGKAHLTLSIETRAGKSIVYRFYPYQTLRVYYTVEQDSEPTGEFYVMSASVAKIISDAENSMTNTPIDTEARN